jgi:hypothetical protein
LKTASAAADVEGEAKAVRTAMEKLQRHKERLLAEFGVRTPQGISSQNVIAVANAGLVAAGAPPSIPRLDWKIPLPRSVARLMSGRGQRALITPWLSAITRVERLGALRTHLGSAADRRGKHCARPIEDAAFEGRNSSVRCWASTRSRSATKPNKR